MPSQPPTALVRTPVLSFAAFAAFAALAALGCGRREAEDPGDFIAAETARVAHAERGRARGGARVICRADADGGLHVVAPGASVVTATGDDGDAEAEIVFADDAPEQLVRGTVSLGFIGDGKLGESHGGNGYYDQGTSSTGWTQRSFGGGGGRRGGSYGRSGGGRSGGAGGQRTHGGPR